MDGRGRTINNGRGIIDGRRRAIHN